ncbi:unnamed protein product [Dovyalis caffra]|uniref:RING-type domain-containing protein n=1 Tax=Dovyalis caffra TaxID=77055 RepID=A0AAV1SMT3_9ROSI|nr:unnamed protein product [Dovyalis caffra]
MSTEPPPFQEAARCDVCKCSFNAFRRRDVMPRTFIKSNEGVDSVTDKLSRLDIDAEKHPKPDPTTQHQSATGVIECKCGMPLCICEAPETKTDPVPMQTKPSSTFTSQSNPKPKKTDATPKNRGSTSSSKPSSVFNHGQMTNGGVDKPQMDYDVNGEGLREAIKNGDTVAVRKLLSEGVDANYRDKQGMSLLHLAALFNRTDIAFILMDSGASVNYENAQGETPLDCAPATLQYKMKQKIEESGQQGPHTRFLHFQFCCLTTTLFASIDIMGFFVEESGLIVSHLLYKAALVLAVLRWALAWALRFKNRTHLPSSSDDSLQQSHPVPCSQQIRDGLILTTFSDVVERVAGVCDTCAVCLSQLRDQDEVRELRNCCHVFHKECIDRWVDHDHEQDENHNTCPLCRAPLLTSSQSLAWTRTEPSWAVERILYLFGDDLMM